MRYYMFAVFTALVLGAVGCGDGDKPDPRPEHPPVVDNNPCAGLDNCVRPDDTGECPYGSYKAAKADGAEYCLTADVGPCEPDCSDPDVVCGQDDRCGGFCPGRCLNEGEVCSASHHCELSDDPCASCAAPKVCDADLGCVCPPAETIREGWAMCANANGVPPVRGWLTRDEYCFWRFEEEQPGGDEMFSERPTQAAEATCSMM